MAARTTVCVKRSRQGRAPSASKLAPNNTLAFWPAAPGDETPSKTFALTVTIGDRSYTLEDFRQGVVYLGGPREVLAYAIAAETIDAAAGVRTQGLFTPVSPTTK